MVLCPLTSARKGWNGTCFTDRRLGCMWINLHVLFYTRHCRPCHLPPAVLRTLGPSMEHCLRPSALIARALYNAAAPTAAVFRGPAVYLPVRQVLISRGPEANWPTKAQVVMALQHILGGLFPAAHWGCYSWITILAHHLQPLEGISARRAARRPILWWPRKKLADLDLPHKSPMCL